MRAGLGLLRLSPDLFWRTTLRELTAAIGEPAAGARPSRAALSGLMNLYPDTKDDANG